MTFKIVLRWETNDCEHLFIQIVTGVVTCIPYHVVLVLSTSKSLRMKCPYPEKKLSDLKVVKVESKRATCIVLVVQV